MAKPSNKPIEELAEELADFKKNITNDIPILDKRTQELAQALENELEVRSASLRDIENRIMVRLRKEVFAIGEVLKSLEQRIKAIEDRDAPNPEEN